MSHRFHFWKFGCSLVRTGVMSGFYSLQIEESNRKELMSFDELCGFGLAVSKYLFREWPKAKGLKRIFEAGCQDVTSLG